MHSVSLFPVLFFLLLMVFFLLNAKFKISCLSLGIFFFINSGRLFFWLLFGHRFACIELKIFGIDTLGIIIEKFHERDYE